MRIFLFSLLASLLSCVTVDSTRHTPKESTVMKTAPQAASLLAGSPTELKNECERALSAAQQGIASLKKETNPLAILEAYDAATLELLNVGARMGLAKNVHPNEAMRDVAEKCEQDVERLSVELSLDQDVYKALSQIDTRNFDAPTQHFVSKTLLEFRRSGVDRDETTRNRVKALNEELVRLGQEFGKNIRDDVRTLSLRPEELAGLPEDYVKAHPQGADGKVTLTTNYPDYFPFMMYAQSTTAREAMWKTYRQRGYPKNEAVLSQLLAKRHELATLLGYKNWAAYNTENKMVGTEDAAAAFIDKVNESALARAQSDFSALLARKKKLDARATTVAPWEQDFLDDKLRNETFGIDSQALRPYFEFSSVQQGVLDVTSRLFGVSFKKITDAKVWHEDVETYDVIDGDTLLGRIHLDMHPREGKYKHAAMFDLTVGQEGKRLPEGVLVCNFPKTTPEAPGLMQHSEVETLFHEFGHLMHHIFGGHQKWAGISGIRTEWDFVEVPSMLLQEWASHPGTLATFARHYQTKEPIPAQTVEKLRASREFGKGVHTRRQMFLSAVALEFHRQAPGFDATALFKTLQPKFEPFRKEHVDGTYFHLAFGHLEGYSASYYTYMWSVVIAKDLLSVFEDKGMLDTASAKRLRDTVLSPGGSKPARFLVKDFLGRDYRFDAYANWMNSVPSTPR